MIRLLPRSLFGQTLLILLAGLVVSQLVGAWIYAGDREQAVRAVGGLAAAQRVANLTRLVEETPSNWRLRIVKELNDPTLKVSLSGEAPVFPDGSDKDPTAQAIAGFVAQQLPERADRRLRVAVSNRAAPSFGHPVANGGDMSAMMNHSMGSMMNGSMGAMMRRAAGAERGLRAAVELPDGSWLSFATTLPDKGPALSQRFFLSLAIMGLIVLAVSAWAVRRVTAPLGLLAGAAERFGKDVGAEPLPELGTTEMRLASRAFNEMQERLRRFVENRTQMLAAISHDLRTPLTLLRLRAEGVENAEERERMLATIAEMDDMIGATLAYARDETQATPRRPTDLSALLASVVDDRADAGLPVTMAPSPPVIVECQPAALKRVLANLLDNAVKYGKQAHAAIQVSPQAVEITIDDAGPGLPEQELARVFQPFYRVEGSRSRETGGIGLGLAIAMSIVRAHGGELALTNRPQGGLRANLRLPL